MPEQLSPSIKKGFTANPLQQPLMTVHGIGKKSVARLKQLNIYTAIDLLTYYPASYTSYKPTPILEAKQADGPVTLSGVITEKPRSYQTRHGNQIITTELADISGSVELVAFNKGWLMDEVQVKKSLNVYGYYNPKYKSFAISKVFSKNQLYSLVPKYHATKGLSSYRIRNLVRKAYVADSKYLKEYRLPKSLRQRYHLLDPYSAITDVQFPYNTIEVKRGRRTLKFLELYSYQLKLQRTKKRNHHRPGIVINYPTKKIRHAISQLPYHLTNAQERTSKEILSDLHSPQMMNRLLQGDVGSGKTVVAALAIYATILSGYQAVLMVPTGVLAYQHAHSLVHALPSAHLKIAVLTHGTSEKKRQALLAKIKRGDYNLIIGTVALIQPDVIYHRLGLVIIDEQHLFGVKQRRALRAKGHHPNSLAMTATPIPRTLAETSYGDMDISVIDQLPKGRQPVHTVWLQHSNHAMFTNLSHLLSQHQQVYVVVPAINNSQQMTNLKSAYHVFKKLYGSRYCVHELYGGMKDDEKNRIINQFEHGKIQVLVSTTVIEVGVDNPHASAIVVINADHFGLAQLHQLRGRVGRGNQKAVCYLLARPRNARGRKRMQVMENTANGFIIAQRDLELRGPGEIFGSNQSGVPKFKLADPLKDAVIMQCAQSAAQQHIRKES